MMERNKKKLEYAVLDIHDNLVTDCWYDGDSIEQIEKEIVTTEDRFKHHPEWSVYTPHELIYLVGWHLVPLTDALVERYMKETG